jgi:uncharacterized cupin superfamily protein
MPSSVHATVAALSASSADGGIRAVADSGAPRTAFAELYTAAGTEVGSWSSTPGGWAIDSRPDPEVVSILSGRARITDADGIAIEVGPGSIFVLPARWWGRWNIIERIEKLYVTIEEETT